MLSPEEFAPADTGDLRLGFSPAEWLRLSGFYGTVGVLHLLGWGLYLYYAARHPALLGLGFAAYMFGLRHAFDADHIAAVDDTVRILLQKGQRSLGVGLFFSLGHATIVLAMTVATTVAATAVRHTCPSGTASAVSSAPESGERSCGWLVS